MPSKFNCVTAGLSVMKNQSTKAVVATIDVNCFLPRI